MSISSNRSRFIIILTTLFMNGALIANSVAGYIAASQSSKEIATAAAMALLHSIRRDFRHSGIEPTGFIKSAIEDLKPQGLKYMGIADEKWNILLSAGGRLSELDPNDVMPIQSEPRMIALHNPWAIRVIVHLPLRHRMEMENRSPEYLVADIESESAKANMSRAMATLVLSLAVAGILLIIAAVFFKMLKRADKIESQLAEDRHLKSLGQISAILGHELRNPIASLKGHAQLLEKKYSDAAHGRASVETILKETERLEALTDQILDFAKTGRLDLTSSDPISVIRSAVEKCGDEHIELSVEGEPARWLLDAAKMEQVAINLLNNARQSSPREAPIKVVLCMQKSSLIIEVKDFGEGIKDGDFERIFEPFFTSRVRGTGLGLALSKRIVEGHGGTIEVANNKEGGALFRVVIPR